MMRTIVLCVLSAVAGCASSSVRGDSRFALFQLSLTVQGLPAGGQAMPVSCEVDLSAALETMGIQGAIDERTIRLYRESGDEVAVQFEPTPQKRGKRRLLPGTQPRVSFAGEYPAGETPTVPKTVGVLTWFATSSRYRLEFGVPRSGRLVQVPYGPSNLRGFDREGRATPLPHFPRMQIRPQWPLEGKLHVLENNELVTTYHVGPVEPDPKGPGSRRPFFYPVIGPDGVGLTEFGKTHDPTGSHGHHYSLWIAHARVNGKNFWSERGGIIAHDRWERLEDGPVYCRIVQRTRWQFEGADHLRGRRTFTIYRSVADARLMDVELEFTPPGKTPVTLEQTTFGFLAARVAASINPFDGGGEILTSEGKRNEQQAHLSHGAWLDQSGPIAPGRWGGVAILDHPANHNHPTGWHCRNDGWAGAALAKDGAVTIQSGKPLRLRYRIVLHRYGAERAGIANRFAEFAASPSVRVGAPGAKR